MAIDKDVQKKYTTSTERDISNKQTGIKKKILCYRCGSPNHLANSKACPAINKTCNMCKKKGHFSSVCKGQGKKSIA